jgi:hypothetical protein
MKTTGIILNVLFAMLPLFAQETTVRPIHLSGPAANPEEEISGLTWIGDQLILLPEVPKGFVYSIPKEELLRNIAIDDSEPITPGRMTLELPDMESLIPGYDGFEAVSAYDDQVIFIIEARHKKKMAAYMLRGEIDPSTNNIRIDDNSLVKIDPPVNLKNISYESLVVYGGMVIPLFEANGANVNPTPIVPAYSVTMDFLASIPFPEIEYRITDATLADSLGRFWVINYFWPGDEDLLLPAKDWIFDLYPPGRTHREQKAVERLIELRYSRGEINVTQQPPIQMELLANESRNWEGLVRIDELGFIAITDKFPSTILAFIPR